MRARKFSSFGPVLEEGVNFERIKSIKWKISIQIEVVSSARGSH